MSKKVTLKRRRTVAKTPTKTKETSLVRIDDDGHRDLVYNLDSVDHGKSRYKIFLSVDS